MKLSILYSSDAKKDLTSVWKGVLAASASFELADEYLDEFMDMIDRKRDFPYSGSPLYYRGLFTGFYMINFKAYIAFYRVSENFIEIARILPAKMDYMKILFDQY